MSSKYHQLADILRSEIRQLQRHGAEKLDTEAQLSLRYHMSRQTVRHALKLLEEEGLICRRHGSGTYISGQTRNAEEKKIAIITPSADDYLFPAILHDAQSFFTAAGYSTTLFLTEDRFSREREILLSLLDQPYSGILAEGTKNALPTPNDDLYRQLRDKGIPVVFLRGACSNLPDFPCIDEGNASGGYQLGTYLLSQGHRRIGGIFRSDELAGIQRFGGLMQALRDREIPIRDDCCLWYDTLDRSALLAGGEEDLLSRFIRHRLKDATAVVCSNDEIAHLLIRRLTDTGRHVPEDIAVVGFDNSFYSQIGPVPITSLGHKPPRIGTAAAQLLLDILSGGSGSNILLEWELVCRASA